MFDFDENRSELHSDGALLLEGMDGASPCKSVSCVLCRRRRRPVSGFSVENREPQPQAGEPEALSPPSFRPYPEVREEDRRQGRQQRQLQQADPADNADNQPKTPPPSIRAPNFDDEGDEGVGGRYGADYGSASITPERHYGSVSRHSAVGGSPSSSPSAAVADSVASLRLNDAHGPAPPAADSPLGRELSHLMAVFQRGLLSDAQYSRLRAEARSRWAASSPYVAAAASTRPLRRSPPSSSFSLPRLDSSAAHGGSSSTPSRKLAGPLLLSSLSLSAPPDHDTPAAEARGADEPQHAPTDHLFEGASRVDRSAQQLDITETHGSFLSSFADATSTDAATGDNLDEGGARTARLSLLPATGAAAGGDGTTPTAELHQPSPKPPLDHPSWAHPVDASPAVWEVAARLEVASSPAHSQFVGRWTSSPPPTPNNRARARWVETSVRTAAAAVCGGGGDVATFESDGLDLFLHGEPETAQSTAHARQLAESDLLRHADELTRRDQARDREFAERRRTALKLLEEERVRLELERKRQAEEKKRREQEAAAAAAKAAAEAKAKAEAEAAAAAAAAAAQAKAQAEADTKAKSEAAAKAAASASAQPPPTAAAAATGSAGTAAQPGSSVAPVRPSATATATTATASKSDGPGVMRPAPDVFGQPCLISRATYEAMKGMVRAYRESDADLEKGRAAMPADQWAAMEREIKKQVNGTVGKISSTQRQVVWVAQKLGTLVQQLPPQFPVLQLLFVQKAAGKLVDQGELLREKWEAVWPLSGVCAALMQADARFTVALDVQFASRCPYTTPRIPSKKAQGQSVNEFRVAAGFKVVGGELESQDAYYSRMGDLLALFAGVCTVNDGRDPGSPHFSLARLWRWLAALCNMRLRKMSVVALYPVLSLAGYALSQKYGRQFHKLLVYVCQEMDTERALLLRQNAPAFTRLDLWLRDYIAARSLSLPKGFDYK